LIGIVGESGFEALPGPVFGQQRLEFPAKGQGCGQIVDGFLFMHRDVLLVHVVEVAGARFGYVVKEAEAKHFEGVDARCQASHGEADQAHAIGMFGHRFPS